MLCYPLTAIPSHNCSPNTIRSISLSEGGFLQEVRAAVDIPKGENIYISYEDIFTPTIIRRQQLLKVDLIVLWKNP